MNPTYKLFGKEPALWMALFSSIVMVVSAFVFPLTIEQQGVLNAVCTATFGLLAAYFINIGGMSSAILGLVKSVIALAVAFGLQLSPEKQALLLTFVSTVSAMFIRTQVVPVISNATNAQIAKAARILIVFFVGASLLGLSSCQTDDLAKISPSLSASHAGQVGLDLNDDVTRALVDFATVKTGNVDLIWALQEAFYASAAVVKDTADFKALVADWTGDGKLADKLAASFGETQGTTASKLIALARKATDTAEAFTKGS